MPFAPSSNLSGRSYLNTSFVKTSNGGWVVSLERSTVVICDAGPLIHLDELRSLDLLTPFEEILVPDAVWQEVRQHRSPALHRRGVRLTHVDVIPAPKPELIVAVRKRRLGIGEEQALRLMQQFPKAMLLTDDGKARSVAVGMGYQVRGTIGVLLGGITLGLRTRRQILKLLRSIPERSTLYIRPSLLSTIIAEVEASPP